MKRTDNIPQEAQELAVKTSRKAMSLEAHDDYGQACDLAVTITARIEMDTDEYDTFAGNMLDDRPDLFRTKPEHEESDGGRTPDGSTAMVAIVAPGRRTILVNTEGYAYARYAATLLEEDDLRKALLLGNILEAQELPETPASAKTTEQLIKEARSSAEDGTADVAADELYRRHGAEGAKMLIENGETYKAPTAPDSFESKAQEVAYLDEILADLPEGYLRDFLSRTRGEFEQNTRSDMPVHTSLEDHQRHLAYIAEQIRRKEGELETLERRKTEAIRAERTATERLRKLRCAAEEARNQATRILNITE